MARLLLPHYLLIIMSLLRLSISIAVNLPSQGLLLKRQSKNVTLTFDDLPTHNGFGKITSYHHLDFSSFNLINTSTAASSGHISVNDTRCATSSNNALAAHRFKTPSLWPRIALEPLAYTSPPEAPFFSLHGMSMKPMNQSTSVCIFITAYGIDEQKSVRSYYSLFACFPPDYPGGYVNITDIFPVWGKAINTIEMHAEAAIGDGDGLEWVDWPFCVDDVTIQVFFGEWEWPELWWPKVIPLLPPLAPFKFDDQEGGMKRGYRQYPPFSKGRRASFDSWRASGAGGVFLSEDLVCATAQEVHS